MFNAPTTTETFKVEAYVYDVKPTITSLWVGGQSLCHLQSRCILHFYRKEDGVQAGIALAIKKKISLYHSLFFQPPVYGGSQVMCKLAKQTVTSSKTRSKKWLAHGKVESLCISQRRVPASTHIVSVKSSSYAPALTPELWIPQPSQPLSSLGFSKTSQ